MLHIQCVVESVLCCGVTPSCNPQEPSLVECYSPVAEPSSPFIRAKGGAGAGRLEDQWPLGRICGTCHLSSGVVENIPGWRNLDEGLVSFGQFSEGWNEC